MTVRQNDTSTIDILSLIQQRAGIQLAGRPTRHLRDGIEYHSNCPWCGGRDRFAIWPEVGRYSCSIRANMGNGCGRHGDAIQFLRDFEDMTFHQACQELDIDRYELHSNLPLFMTRDESPPKKWMEAAEAFVWRAERYLWSEKGKRGLDYLREKRGLNDATIREARLGFCPDWYSESLENWGLSLDMTGDKKEIKVPLGIVIPWFVENKIWKIAVRRPDKRYFQVLGSSDTFYNVDALKSDRPVFLFEGEFDTLSAVQTAGDLAAMVATGGAAKGQASQWISKLKQAPYVLVAFDVDENETGMTYAEYWVSILSKATNAFRWLPWSHDCNDMLKQGLPIRLWVEQGLQTAHVVEQLPTPAVPKRDDSDAPLLPCKFCHVRKWHWYRADAEWICVDCYSPARWTQEV